MKKRWKLTGKWKVLIPVYAVLFVLLAVVPSVLADIYYVTHTTAFETGKVMSLIGLCAVTDVVIWGLSATVIVVASVLIMVLVQLVRFIIDTVKTS